MTIKRLSVQLANQIAAGEVVERPASVVKELLENAVDAGGTKILLEVMASGRQLIRVRDNGQGIPKDELPLALAPHATSKISTLEDLNAIVTLGFRGEALASIASVSKLTLTSKIASSDKAYSVSVEGPEQQCQIFSAAHPNGTTVDVCELFFNTPARRRFLKSDRTELLRLKDVFIRCALAHPNLGFELISDGKCLSKVSPANNEEQELKRLGKLIGNEFEREGIAVLGENPGLKVKGVIIPPPPLFATVPDAIYLFLNGRPVADRLLTHALREAFCSVSLGKGSSVRAVIYLECDPTEVDVNVHPRKDEVRFHNPTLIHDLFVNAIEEAFLKSGCNDKHQDVDDLDSIHQSFVEEGERAKVQRVFFEHKENLPDFPKGVSGAVPISSNNSYRAENISNLKARARFLNKVETDNKILAKVRTLSEIQGEILSDLKLVYKINPEVLLVASSKRLFMVKVRALLKIYESKAYSHKVLVNACDRVAMLMPFLVKITKDQIKALKGADEALERCGFKIEIGQNKVSILEIPAVIRGCDLASLAPVALGLIAASVPSILKGNCPAQLSLLIADYCAPNQIEDSLLEELLKTSFNVDSLLSLGDDCCELPIFKMAEDFIKKFEK